MEEFNEQNIEQIIEWSDEECQNFEGQIPVILVRDVLKKWQNLSNDYLEVYKAHNQLTSILSSGRMIGYTITCPECKVSYSIKPEELNYNIEITCQDCGARYIQNKNIVGIWVKGAEDEQ